MKKLILNALIASGLLVSGYQGFCQDQKDDKPKQDQKDVQPSVDKSGAKAQLAELVGKIQAKLKDGKNTEKDLEPFFKDFDDIVAKHKDEKTDDVAQVILMKAMLYSQVLDNDEKATELFNQLKKDFPDTNQAKSVDKMLENIKKQADSKKIQKTLVAGVVFPDFDEKDMQGNPLSVAKFKGKIVLVDFWATWCGPCVGELPNVLKTYQKYHDKGFEIIGISLDQKKEDLEAFLKKKEMTWPQYFDGKGWQSKLAGKYGVNSIPATYLIDKEGKIAAKNLRGEALETEVGKLLEK